VSDDALVLCYHAVSESWPADLSVTSASLERQVEALLRQGYRGVRFAEAVSNGTGRRVAVTFDDAYRSVHERALPILERLGVPGTVFVPTAHVGSDEPMAWAGIDRWLGGPHESELLCMGVPELADLRARGWEIGAHTHTHPRLTQVGAGQLAEELERPRALLEQWLGEPCATLAYPYGDVSPAVAEAARAAGYTAAATLDPNVPPGDPILWPRVGVYHADAPWRFRLKASPAVRRIGLARLRHPLKSRR
jgi:peptidoglycan/xylan/chitin deacetylase (PgdA/CDA1 family)